MARNPDPRRRPRTLIWILLPLCLYATVCLLAWLFQERLIYLPSPGSGEDPGSIGLPFSDLYLESRTGERIHAWWIPHRNPRAVVLFCHGNAGRLEHRLGTLQRIHRLGLSILIFDYPGYGSSGGSPTEDSVLEAARAAHAEVLSRAVREAKGAPSAGNPLPVILWGRSLGAAVAAELAAASRPAALILEAGFTSIPEMARRRFPWLPIPLLLRVRHDTRRALSRQRAPVLIVHGLEDDLVPVSMAHSLLSAASEPRRLLLVPGGHADFPDRDREAYEAGIRAFLDATLQPAGGNK